MLVISLDWKSDEPTYHQIADQIRACIASGELPAGTALPPVRSIASDLGVNLNTVARAYRILEEENFVSIRGRTGVVVSPPARSIDGSAITGLRGELGGLLARMRQAGMSIAELKRFIEQQLDGMSAGSKK